MSLKECQIKRNFMFKMWLIKFRSVKLRCVSIVAIVVCACYILTHNTDEPPKTEITKKKVHNTLTLKNVILHLDFKGFPLKMTYLKSLLPKLRSLGVTGLLMEYEDMFPYKETLVNLSATNHYTIDELQEFISLAIQIGLDVIPLVQTFGHMEHVLKLQEFQHLREVSLFPDSICPSQSESYHLIKNMLYQIINFHQKIFPLKYLHIGGDEVFNLNKCEKCLKRKLSDMDVYLNHISTISDIIQTKSPLTSILIWDDMLRKVPMNKWRDVSFRSDRIEPVYWNYRPSFNVAHSSLIQYHKKFKNIWIASAFKGADGKIATFPDLRKRFLNHFNWLRLMVDYKFGGEDKVYEFGGIILTGWSRYSHTQPPCELFPVSIPSLYLNLLLIKNFKYIDPQIDEHTIFTYTKYLQEDFTGNLKCSNEIYIEHFDTSHCYFSENELFKVLKYCEIFIEEFTKGIRNIHRKLDAFETESKITDDNMGIWIESLKWCNDSIKDLNGVKNNLANNLSYYYNSSFVDEYINFKLYSPMKKINELIKALQKLFKVRS